MPNEIQPHEEPAALRLPSILECPLSGIYKPMHGYYADKLKPRLAIVHAKSRCGADYMRWGWVVDSAEVDQIANERSGLSTDEEYEPIREIVRQSGYSDTIAGRLADSLGFTPSIKRIPAKSNYRVKCHALPKKEATRFRAMLVKRRQKYEQWKEACHA